MHSETMAYHAPAYFYAIAALAMFYFAYNLRGFFAFRLGKEELHNRVNCWQFLKNIIVYGAAQARIYKFRFGLGTVAHIFIAWGFIELFFATTVDFIRARGFMLEFLPDLDVPWFALVNDSGGLFVFIGVLLALYRRLFAKPELLPQNNFSGRNLFGDTGVLIYIAILIITGFMAEAGRLGQGVDSHYSYVGMLLVKMFSGNFWADNYVFLWWFHAGLSFLAIALLPKTKLLHVIAAMGNAGLTNMEKRGQIRPMFIEKMMEDTDLDPETIEFGANSAKDFSWKQLLDGTACTECSRCSQSCPANMAGLPLSPMDLIQDIRAQMEEENTDGETNSIIGNRISEQTLWSCTTCGACMEACPVLVEHVPSIVEMRRNLVLMEGSMPDAAAESLEKTTNTGNPWGFPARDRLKWASDHNLDVPVFKKKKKADVLFWVGCAGSYDPRNQDITRAIVDIFNAAEVDFAVLGTEESCTGDSARRIGEENTFETQALKNIETLQKYEFNKIVTACPHCMNTLSKEYADFGADFKVYHHSEFLNFLLQEGKIQTQKTFNGDVTYHDACYLGRHNGIYDAPRDIIRQLGAADKLIEMEHNHDNSFCCGAGGGNMWYEMDEGERMNKMRFNEAMETGAKTIATACSFCAIMMDDAMKVDGKEDSVAIKDLAELIRESM